MYHIIASYIFERFTTFSNCFAWLFNDFFMMFNDFCWFPKIVIAFPHFEIRASSSSSASVSCGRRHHRYEKSGRSSQVFAPWTGKVRKHCTYQRTPHPSHQNGTTPRCPHRANDPDTALRGRSSGKQSEEVAACYFGREWIERGQYSLPKYQKEDT